MRKTLVYTLLVVLPAAFLVWTNIVQANTAELYERIQLSTGGRLLYFSLPPLTVAILLFLFLYSLRFSNQASYRILLGVLTALYFIVAVYINFFNAEFLPVQELATVLIMQDMAKYAGYYGGTLLFVLFTGKRRASQKKTHLI